MARVFEYDWSWTLPATQEELWPLVSDTNRFNRDAGLPPVEDARAPDERLANARRKLTLRVKGVTLQWEELPFEWLRPHSFGVIRRYSRGPLREMRVHATLEPVGPDRTRLRYRVTAEPRGLFGLVTTPLQIGIISKRTFGRTFQRYAVSASKAPGAQMSSPVPKPRSRDRLDRLRKRLVTEGVDAEAADRLINHVLAADDFSLARIRPYALANAWGLPKRQVLSWCLRAAKAGLLDLQWDVICPKCVGAKDEVNTLRDLRSGTVHCDTCLIEFSTDFDQSVELSFTPTPAVREVEAPPFCVAGPQITPHVEVQQLLGAGERRPVAAELVEGRHRAKAWGVEGGPSFLVEAGGVGEVELRVRADGWDSVPGPVAPDARLTLVNDTGEERLFGVERTAWADEAATAAEVTALAEFRDLFSSEVLEVGDFIGVGNLAVLFTDLKDSTRMYRQIGDAPAFGRVMRHFEVLQAEVAAAGGAVVKTIGDAVMAVFRNPDDSLRAVRASQRALCEEDEPLTLKAGVHYGHCIAVNLNERLDYFGSTVNIAARLGGLSGGNDIVISREVLGDPAVRELLVDWELNATSFTTNVRGLDKPLQVWRIAASPEGG